MGGGISTALRTVNVNQIQDRHRQLSSLSITNNNVITEADQTTPSREGVRGEGKEEGVVTWTGTSPATRDDPLPADQTSQAPFHEKQRKTYETRH